MTQEKIWIYAKLYRESLLEEFSPFRGIPFQIGSGGRYLTCLDKIRSVYDFDKSSWLPQARQACEYSVPCNKLEKDENWLRISQNGVRFLKKYGCDSSVGIHLELYMSAGKILKN